MGAFARNDVNGKGAEEASVTKWGDSKKCLVERNFVGQFQVYISPEKPTEASAESETRL